MGSCFSAERMFQTRLDAAGAACSQGCRVLLPWGQFSRTKDTLNKEVHQITDIQLTALRGTCLSHFPVDERFRWSKNRDTQLEEDQVYCLLGIFDVSIPVIYCEGQAKARDRLRREIGGKLFTRSEALSMTEALLRRNPTSR